MTKKAYIIHGWGGKPEGGWIGWLKEELEKKGFEVETPTMPDTDYPKIEAWVGHLSNIAEADEDTILIGHSIGSQTIFRYLERLPEGKKIRAAISVAGWVNLTEECLEDKEDAEIAKPWIENEIDFEKVKKHCDNFVSFFSDNDPDVPLSDSEIFREKLGGKIIIEKNKGHYCDEDESWDKVLEEILKISP